MHALLKSEPAITFIQASHQQALRLCALTTYADKVGLIHLVLSLLPTSHVHVCSFIARIFCQHSRHSCHQQFAMMYDLHMPSRAMTVTSICVDQPDPLGHEAQRSCPPANPHTLQSRSGHWELAATLCWLTEGDCVVGNTMMQLGQSPAVTTQD